MFDRWKRTADQTEQAIQRAEQTLDKARQLATTDPEAARKLVEQAGPALLAAKDQSDAAGADMRRVQVELQQILDRMSDDT